MEQSSQNCTGLISMYALTSSSNWDWVMNFSTSQGDDPLLHELSLKSKENKFEDLRRRLAESILFILPDVLESAHVEKVDRCIDIWRRWKMFENDMIDRFDRFVESRKQDQPDTTLKKQKQKRNYEPLASGSEISVEAFED